jgi:hypothetical protein
MDILRAMLPKTTPIPTRAESAFGAQLLRSLLALSDQASAVAGVSESWVQVRPLR